MFRTHSVLFFVSLAACQTIIAADSDDKKLQASIAESAKKYETLYAARDAHGLAGLFTVEAELIDSTGTIFHGRESIEAEYKSTFANEPEGKISIELVSIRPVAVGLVVEDGVVTFTPSEKKAGPVERTRYTATHVKQADGTWLLASVRELEQDRATPHERLQAMAWLIGEWHEEVDGTSIATKWNWSKDHNFLVSEFTVVESREKKWHGSNRLGWDAERKQFRSWIFDSSGGFGEGFWNEDDGGGWSVNLSAIDADGVRSSSKIQYTSDGANAIRVTQQDRVRAGISLPGSSHRIVRQPPTPAGASTK
ncbi:YybH family protein [Schlesneria paludicola]|uniref:YybH family protein n=1 Tax=Schlesneria paludicola TaxID=360056 RepID=UPI00029A9B05|nr:SgcJ/EcaC family oxidoreductase [Schlesneria paludicola]